MKKRRTRMALGPLEYLVIGFEGNRFTGQFLPELRTARDNGIIRVVDLFWLRKDESGNVAALELSDLSSEEAEHLAPLAGELLSLLTPEDIEHASGIVVAGGLVAPDVLRELEEEFEASQQPIEQDQAAVKATQ
jgi:hypothetical protein